MIGTTSMRGRHRTVTDKSVRGQFHRVAGGRIAGSAVQAVTLGLVARWSGPADFALVAAVIGAAQASTALADLGISPSLARLRATSPRDPAVRRLVALNGRVSLLLGLCWAAALLGAGLLSGDDRYLLLLGVAVWVVAEKNTETWLLIPMADGDAFTILASVLFRRIQVLAILVALTLVGLEPVAGYSVGLAVSALAGAAWTRGRIWKQLPETSPGRYLPLLRQALPFWINTVGVLLRYADVTLVRAVSGDLTAGAYAAPSRMIGPLSLLPSVMSQVLLPHAARGNRRNTASLLRLLAGVIGLMAVLLTMLAVWAGEVLRFALGEGYAASAGPLRIIIIAALLFGVLSPMVTILQARGDEWFVAGTSVGTTVLLAVAVFVGARAAGAQGAAVGYTVGTAAHASLLGWRLFRRRHDLWVPGPTSREQRSTPVGVPTSATP